MIGSLMIGNRESKFLALHKGSESFSKTYEGINTAAEILRIEFFFLEIGEWEASGQYQDEVYLKIGGTTLDLTGFDKAYIEGNREEYFEGFKEGISWNRRAVSESMENFGFGSNTDQLHQVSVTVPKQYHTFPRVPSRLNSE
ncbi:expressed unknown protein [Seminavis robusta]|uniref:Uncharacterized protein n=1 Tax=Seminavis robusta TaxID=568900 RepID=A0A9N8I1P2_9STRA|nr:expressed unknown protein [Seminavis robusta]|eukprot:Sro4023_g352570.1 n/a (142) ;mRNA; f:477-1068